jgi:hypothetical protein
MRMLASFPKLRVLDVQYTLVMDGGLADLHKLPALQILSVSWTSDVGLTSIAQCKGLTALDFSLSKITDKGLAELSNMPALTSLDIQSNMITKSAVEDFRRSHPNVRVLVAPVYDSSVPQSLWRTYDLLKRLGYFGYNFETHTPTYFQRKWVFEAYCEFRDFTTEDRWYGMLGPTAILNHACRQDRMELVHLATEGLRAGFWGKPPPGYETVVEQCRGKAFLNFDDDTFADPPQ